MALIVPNLTGLQWGPNYGDVFDVLLHPTRDASGNPCIMFRYGGGGTGGDYKTCWSSTLDLWYLWVFLNGSNAFNLTNQRHFDIIAVQTSQVLVTGTGNFRRSRTLYFEEQCMEWNQAVASIKAQGARGFQNNTNQRINPSQVFSAGTSHGASIALNASIVPPIYGQGSLSTNFQRRLSPGSQNSLVRGVINHLGQIDVRTIAGVDQIHYTQLPGWFGTRTDTAAEFNALSAYTKASASYLAYIQNGDTRFYRPTYNVYIPSGTHVHPYGDPGVGGSNIHDSNARLELNAALTSMGLPYGTTQYNAGEWTYAYAWVYGSAGNPSASSKALSQGVYDWMNAILMQPSAFNLAGGIAPLP